MPRRHAHLTRTPGESYKEGCAVSRTISRLLTPLAALGLGATMLVAQGRPKPDELRLNPGDTITWTTTAPQPPRRRHGDPQQPVRVIPADATIIHH